ncbi:hypothetical protein AB5N19_02038 [Seiridium cardinale]
MAAPQLDNKIIRSSVPPELARYLQTQLKSSHWKTISDHLVASVATGSIPPDVFQVWLAVCKSADAIVAALRQDVSVLARHVAIRRFGKWLRRDADFSAIWTAVGQVKGLVDLMAAFSVDHVRVLCQTISFSCRATGAVTQRQQAMSELYDTLHGKGEVPNPDARPLESFYEQLLPACTVETALAHTKDRTPGRKALDVHGAAYEARALRELFPIEGKPKTVAEFTKLFEKNHQFAYSVLKRIATDRAALEFNGGVLLRHVILPLLRHLTRARNQTAIDPVLSLTLNCAQLEPKVAESLSFDKQDVLFYAIQHWKRSHNREKAEELLTSLIAAVPRENIVSFPAMASLVRTVDPVLRWSLLHLFLLHAKRYTIDINAETDEDDKKLADLGSAWTVEFFMYLHAPAALRLFLRLAKARPDGKFISRGYYSREYKVVTSTAVGDRRVDSDIIGAHLQSQLTAVLDEKSEWFMRAKKLVFERRNKASNTRESEERAEWAESAFKLSIATGSLNLYADTLLWARRFNRDHHTVKSLYQSPIMHTEEGLDLLSALPTHKAKQRVLSLEDIKAAVIKSNEIMFALLETAAMGIQEPWFSQSDWNSVRELPAKIMGRRLQRFQTIQDERGFSDEEISNAIWEPTIDFLIKTEKFCLEEPNGRLGLDNIHGTFEDWRVAVLPTTSACTFLDRLAKQRDALWAEFRPTVHPATTTLRDQWPRGLPVQALCPEIHLFRLGLPSMPFLEARCERVVFSDKSVLDAVPDDKETQEAIGPFVDHYAYAFRIYFLGAKQREERIDRLRKAWAHATTVLTGTRMSAAQAIDFWKAEIISACPFEHNLEDDLARLNIAPQRKSTLPQLPESEDDGSPAEWDPWPMPKASRESPKHLHRTCLDCMLGSRSRYYGAPKTVNGPFYKRRSQMPSQQLSHFWSIHKYETDLSGPAKDALIAASISYINTKYGADSSLFLKHFPSEDDVRYPALYLDDDFLEKQKTRGATEQLGILSCFSSRVPISLTVQLSHSLMARLKKSEKEDPEVREAAMAVIKWLVHSDCPERACHLVQQVVLDRQDDSSWHRHVFNTGFLRRLSSNDAKTLLGGLAAGIQQRQEKHVADQARRKARRKARIQHTDQDGETTRTPTSDESILTKHEVEAQSTAPMIKVTTIKMFAQILRDANFIDRGFACDALFALLNSSSHPDIQFAIVEGLISTLVQTKDRKLRELIYGGLTTHVIPIASSINERRLTKEEVWLAAEAGDGPLPEIYDGSPISSHPPLLQLLSNAAVRWKEDSPEYHDWVTRILMPIAERSAQENTRWNAIFMKRHSFEIPPQYLPAIPVKPSQLLNYWTTIPQSRTDANFETLKRYALVNLRPHIGLLAANEAVKKNADLLKSNAGKHWLYLWDNPGNRAFDCGINQIAVSLYSANFSDTHEVNTARVQELLRNLMVDFISKAEVGKFEQLMGVLGSVTLDRKEKWKARILPLLEYAITEIDGLRTEEWQRNPQRSPSRLPQTLPIKQRIMMGKYVKVNFHTLSQKSIDDFLAEYSALIDEMIAHDAPYHDQWVTFPRPLAIFYPFNCLSVALALVEGIQTQAPTLAESLKLEVADFLLRQNSKARNEQERERAKTVLNRWVNSPVERIRLRGEATFEQLRELARHGDGWLTKDDAL